MIITFQDLLTKKYLGPIRLGQDRTEVRALLGEPEDWIITQKRKTKDRAIVWKYGSFEFSFDENRLCMIAIYFGTQELRLPENVIIEGYFPSKYTTDNELRKCFLERCISYSEDRLLTFDNQVCWILNNKISFIFSAQNGRENVVDKMLILD